MKKIKILHIINNLEVGGAERVLLIILEQLSKYKDIEIFLVSLEGHGSLEKEFLKLPIKYKKFNYHLFVPILRKFELYFRFRLFLYGLKIKPDIIHGHLLKGEDFAKLLGGLLHRPVITTSHDCLIKPGRKQKWLNRYLTKATAVSQLVANHLSKYYKLPKEKIVIIPDAVKNSDFEKSKKVWDPKNPVFVYTGRLIELKGVQYAIKGLSRLQKEHPNIKLNIYGDGIYRKKLEELIHSLKTEFIFFKGRVSDLPSAYKSGDIFILPSKSEGFSMATLEALASGKAIIATKTGAIGEMIKEGKNGYFIEKESEESIYRKCKQIINEDVNKMGLESQRIAGNHFSIEKIVEKYYNLYLQVLDK